ncbi:MAG: HEAT repeat domain-containing protein, partial [Myxococcales bacterium]
MPAETPAAAPKATPERVKAVREFFAQLRKGVKTIGMYRHTPSRFPEYLRPAFLALSEALKDGPLGLKVSAESFDFGDEQVWAVEGGGDNVPGRFFREGVRHLILRPGTSEAELTRLVMIMLSNPDRGGADITTQLMNASFEHIEYLVVEGFTVGEMSEEQVEVEVDAIVQYLYGRLRGASDDTLAFARVSAADLELRLDNVEGIRGLVLEGDAIAESFKQRVQQELAKDESSRLHFQLAQLIFWQLREGRVEDVTTATEVLTQMIDGMLLQENLSALPPLLDQLEGLDTGPDSAASRVLKGLSAHLGEEHRLRRLGDGLKLNASYDLRAAGRYLSRLDATAVPPLLDVLEGIEQPERRAVLIEALAHLGKDSPQFFAARLNSEKSQTVRDMIAIIEKASFPDRAKYIQTAIKNPNPAVRIEVLSILANSKAVESVHRFVLDATVDKSAPVRHAAFKALVTLSPLRATQDLLRLPKLPDWDKRPQAEKELIYECMGQAGTPDVFRHVISLLQQKKSLFSGKKVTENKLLAVTALRSANTLQAFKLLQSVAENKDSESEVAAAARKAMLQVRRAMTEAARASASEAAPAAQASPTAASSAETQQAADQLFGDFVAAREEAAAEAAAVRRRAAAMREQERADAAAAAKARRVTAEAFALEREAEAAAMLEAQRLASEPASQRQEAAAAPAIQAQQRPVDAGHLVGEEIGEAQLEERRRAAEERAQAKRREAAEIQQRQRATFLAELAALEAPAEPAEIDIAVESPADLELDLTDVAAEAPAGARQAPVVELDLSEALVAPAQSASAAPPSGTPGLSDPRGVVAGESAVPPGSSEAALAPGAPGQVAVAIGPAVGAPETPHTRPAQPAAAPSPAAPSRPMAGAPQVEQPAVPAAAPTASPQPMSAATQIGQAAVPAAAPAASPQPMSAAPQLAQPAGPAAAPTASPQPMSAATQIGQAAVPAAAPAASPQPMSAAP